MERDYGQENKNRARQAKERGIVYTLKPLFLLSLYKKTRCYYLNMPLNVKIRLFSKQTKLTLDRKDPHKGYIKNNVVASSHFANQLKALVEGGLITADDIIECGKKIKETLNQDN